jgi:hypothetical protein
MPDDAIRRRLEARRLELADEMRHYPTPIAGCDQQFNWLLDQYAHVQAQLRRLEAQDGAPLTAEQRATFDPDEQPHEAYPHDTVHSH